MIEESVFANLPRFRERRGADRSRLIVEISFAGSDATGVAHTRDISAGGLYMNTEHQFAEGDLITVRLPLGSRHAVIGAQVVYSNPGHGVGVRFFKVSDEDRAAIEDGLAQR